MDAEEMDIHTSARDSGDAVDDRLPAEATHR